MQFIRAEMHAFRRMVARVYEIPKRRSCHCITTSLSSMRYNKQLSSNRTRHKVNLRRFSDTPYSSLFDDTDENNVDANLGQYNVRNSLHTDSDDPLTHKINGCHSVDDLFALLNEQFEHLKGEHASQFVLVLWDLQKIYNESYLHHLVNEDVERSPEFMLTNYLNKLQDHKDFNKLLQLLDVYCMELTVSEASCCLLYLRKIGVAASEEVMMRLLERCEEAVRDASDGGQPQLTLIDITRLSAAIEPKDNYRYLSIVQQFLPTVLEYLDRCNSPDELRLLTFIFYNTSFFITEPLLNRYKDRIRHLIATKVLNKEHYSVLLKVVNLLNLPLWSWSNVRDVQQIYKLVAPEIPNMDASSIVILHKVFQTYLEPAGIVEPLHERASYFIKSMLNDDRISQRLRLPRLLFCHITNIPPEKRPAYEKIISGHISNIFPSTIAVFYKMLRYIKSSNTQLCDLFWGKTISYLLREKVDDNHTLKFSHKYMNFSSVGQMYRNIYFERLMLDLMMKMFDDGIVGIFPKKFSKLCSFILAYGYSNNSVTINDMERIIQHLEALKGQFGTSDLLLMSRGLQFSMFAMSKRHTPPVIAHLYHRADNVVTEQANTIAKRKDLSLVDLNTLIKCHIFKKTNPNSDITYELIRKFTTIPNRTEQLNSHSIRDSAYSLLSCGVIVPSLFEDIASYVVAAKTDILGDTAYKVLNLFYGLGYTPKKREAFEVFCEVIERDKCVMNSLSLLHSSCALAYFEHLPESLIKYIFSIHFMERLDAEVANCYQKWLYPTRVRHQLMRLNRSVCLEMPQHRIPWFHQKYMQEQISLLGAKKTPLERSVTESVRALWPKAHIRSPHYTPYGYKMNLLLSLDNEENTRQGQGNDGRNRVAIMLLDGNNFCKRLEENSDGEGGHYTSVVNGTTKHQRRHLEILGYRPVEISASVWYSMYMTEPNVKADFLKQKILEKSVIK